MKHGRQEFVTPQSSGEMLFGRKMVVWTYHKSRDVWESPIGDTVLCIPGKVWRA